MRHGLARSHGREVPPTPDVEVAYTIEGDGDETVLLIMGLGGRAADWGTCFPGELARKYRVVRVDNRGVGRSPKVAGGYTLSDLARDAVAVLDHLEIEKAHVAGISMGGMISQLVALEHPGRVANLLLLSTHFGGRRVEAPHPDAMRLFDPGEFLNHGRDPAAMMRFTLSIITAPGFSEKNPGVVEEMIANVREQPTSGSAFMAQVQAILTSDRADLVREIRHRTLVVHGNDDKLIPPSNGRALAEAIPGARLVMMNGVGHMPMIEAPDELARIVLAFLSS